MEFVSTVTANNDEDVENAKFNPFTGLLDLSKFDRVRWVIEVLSASAANLRMRACGRMSKDGVVFEAPGGAGEEFGPDETHYGPWVPVTSDGSASYLQLGVLAYQAMSTEDDLKTVGVLVCSDQIAGADVVPGSSSAGDGRCSKAELLGGAFSWSMAQRFPHLVDSPDGWCGSDGDPDRLFNDTISSNP